MRRNVSLWTSSVLCGLGAFWLATVWGGRAAVPPPEQLLPQDTLFVVTVPDWTRLTQQWKQSPIGRLCQDPAMQKFVDRIKSKFQQEIVKPLEEKLGIHLADFQPLLQGQVTLAVSRAGWEGGTNKEPAALVLIDTRNQAQTARARLNDLQELLRDHEVQFHPEDIRGHEFTVIQPIKKDKTAEIWVGLVQSMLIVGTQRDAIAGVLAHLEGASAPSLVDQEAFQRDKDFLRDQPSLWGWVDVQTWVQFLSKALEHARRAADAARAKQGRPLPPGPRPDPAKIFNALGISSLRSLTWAHFSRPDGESELAFLRVAPEERKGLLALPIKTDADASPPEYVSEDVASFYRVRIDLPKAWQTFTDTINPLSGGLIQMMIANLEQQIQQTAPDFSFQDGLIANLGDDLMQIEYPPKQYTLKEIGRAPSVFCLGSSNPKALLTAIRQLVKGIGMEWEEQELLGRKVYIIRPPTIAAGLSPEQKPQGLYVTQSNGYVLFSPGQEGLQRILHGPATRPLIAKPGLREAVDRVGGWHTGIFIYGNAKVQARTFYEGMLRNPRFFENLALMFSVGSKIDSQEVLKKIKEWIDPTLLPPFDQIEKYFSFVVETLEVTPDGFQLRSFSPRPQQ